MKNKITNTEDFCKQHNLCRGCKFVGRECVKSDDEMRMINYDGTYNSKFYDRMAALIKFEISNAA